MNERILISGSSIAGLTLAFWLARHGFRPTVVERAPGIRTGGNGVDVRGQAVEVTERMGVLPRVRAAAADVTGMSFVNAAGNPVARIDLQAIQRRYGSGEVEIMRGDLAALLFEVTRHDIEYIFDDSISALEQDRAAVTVTFEGGVTRRFDLVVGADGLHSTVRRLAFGPDERFLRYLGHCGAFADADPALGADRWMTLYNLPGKAAGIYRSGNHEAAKAYFLFRTRDLPTYDYRNVGQQKQLLSDAFADVSSWHVPQLLADALSDEDFYFDTLSQVRMPSWSYGRISLVGDAAHCASPISGAGAMLAIIGAYRLAGELAAAGGNHRIAFSSYENAHRPLVKRSQSNLFVGMVAPRSRTGIWARNTMARLPLIRAMAGLERRVQPRTEPLPDYREQTAVRE